MRHFKDPKFKPLYDALPLRVRRLADKNFALLKQNPKHPSLHFKRVKDDLWSVRVGLTHRELATEGTDGFQWFWIGSHAEYDRLVS
jgi:hypothetical protein